VEELLAQSDRWLNRRGRLTHPMLLKKGGTHYEAVSWDQAFAKMAEHFHELASPDDAIFYTSGRTSNEAAFLYQLFVRKWGTNNLPDCSNLCHESSGNGLTEVIGIGKGTVQLSDFEVADCIFVIGQNPGTNHPRMLTTLQEAARRGAKIVVINPLKEPGLVRFKHPQEVFRILGKGTPIATDYVQLNINGDVALLKGMMRQLLEWEEGAPGSTLDRDFIAAHTSGFEAFRADLMGEDWDAIVTESGVSREAIERLAATFRSSERVIVCWAMGLTQHVNGVANVQSVVNLLLMGGHLGREGAGACPVRGHSNVQGDRTMGIWEAPQPAFLDALAREFDFDPPRTHGLNAVAAVSAMASERGKVFVAMGGNFALAAPDTEATRAALGRCRLTVQISTKLNRSHLIHGEEALILPCLGRTERDLQEGVEQFVSVEDSMGLVHASRGHLTPASPTLKSEPRIVCDLARAVLGESSSIDWKHMGQDYDRVRDAISRVIEGFEHYNKRVRDTHGFSLPNTARERDFRTSDGKAQFTVHGRPDHRLAEGQLLLMTLRSHDQYNTTIYTDDDRYRGVRGDRRIIFMNADDVAERGLAAGQAVNITSHWKGETRQVKGFKIVSFDLPQGSTAMYFPEANPLVPLTQKADRSHTPASKSVIIRVRACGDE
jgi:molybdopterin-dependent oxidoreductase alpha subunit